MGQHLSYYFCGDGIDYTTTCTDESSLEQTTPSLDYTTTCTDESSTEQTMSSLDSRFVYIKVPYELALQAFPDSNCTDFLNSLYIKVPQEVEHNTQFTPEIVRQQSVIKGEFEEEMRRRLRENINKIKEMKKELRNMRYEALGVLHYEYNKMCLMDDIEKNHPPSTALSNTYQQSFIAFCEKLLTYPINMDVFSFK